MGVDVIICLEQGADCLHMVQLMWLHASFKSRLILPFWYPLTLDVLEKRLLNGCCSSNSSIAAAYQAALHTWSAKMQPFATYVAQSVWLSVCLFTYASVCCIQQWVLFGLRTHVGPKNHVIGEGLDPKEMDNFTGCFPTGMHCNVMSMWSLRWHFTNKSVTGAPYSIKGYSYSLSHSWTLWWRVRWLKQCHLEVAAVLQQIRLWKQQMSQQHRVVCRGQCIMANMLLQNRVTHHGDDLPTKFSRGSKNRKYNLFE